MLDRGPFLELEPIGIVHSSVVERREMPDHGVTARVEVFPEFQDGLYRIEDNTHLWIIGWFVGAARDQLQIVRPEYLSGQRRRGVFGLRATTRPNSIGLCPVHLRDIQDGVLTVEQLDFLDGTPVLDIKRYSPSWDSVFSARSAQDRSVEPSEAARLNLLEIDGAKFHGALTPHIAAAARLMQIVVERWQVLPRDPELSVTVPLDPEYGEFADALQGMTGATLGTGRLNLQEEATIIVRYQDKRLTAKPLSVSGHQPDDVRRMEIAELFTISDI